MGDDVIKSSKDFSGDTLSLPEASSSATGMHDSLHDSRRTHKRFDVSMEGTCSTISDVDKAIGIEFPVTIKNISHGGTLFLSPKPLTPGITIILSYKPPSKGTAPGYGIQEKRICMEIIRQKEVSGKDGIEYVIVARTIEAKTSLRPELLKTKAKVLKQLLIIKSSADMLVAKGVRAYEQFFDSILEEKGYEVSIANNVREALMMLREGDFDAILSDSETVCRDGYELLKVIRYEFPDIDLIMTTRGGREWFNCLLERAEEYVEKLIDGKEINIALEKRLMRLLSDDSSFIDNAERALRQKVINVILNRIDILNKIRDTKDGESHGKTQYQRKFFRMYLPEDEQIPCTKELESGQIIECTVTDLSVEGFSTLLDARGLDLLPGTQVKDVRIPLPNGDLVKGQAVVKFISPITGSSNYNCGMEFVNLHVRFREKISKYIYETHGDAIKKIKGKIDAFC
jgi:CheY-like chemotaxis protein